MTTLTATRSEFDRAAKEFFDALPDSTREEADAGFKCLVLMYFGLDGTERDTYEAAIVVKIAARKILDYFIIEE